MTSDIPLFKPNFKKAPDAKFDMDKLKAIATEQVEKMDAATANLVKGRRFRDFIRECCLWEHNYDGRNPSLPGDIGRKVAEIKKKHCLELIAQYPDFPEALKHASPRAFKACQRMMRS